MGVWTFIQDQLLGMKWLNGLIGAGLEALGLDVDGRVGGNDEIAIIFLHVRQQGGGQAGRDGIAALRAAVTHGRADGRLESPGRIAAPQRIADGRQPAPL